MESWRFSVSEHSTLRAGIFKASGCDPMWIFEERGSEASALRSSSRWARQVIPRHGCIPADSASVSPSTAIV